MSKRFNTLAEKVTREYEKKGYSPAKARVFGRATAGKVYQEQRHDKEKEGAGNHDKTA